MYLDEEQDRLLEHLAKIRRVSKSQLIRESIARYLRHWGQIFTLDFRFVNAYSMVET